MRDQEYEAIVLGGGHNGLTAAAYLARAGVKTLVLERREVLGGAAASEAIFPGYLVPTGAVDSGLFSPLIVKELGLRKHGLQFLQSPVVVYLPSLDGEGLALWRDPQQAMAEIARFSPQDARRYPHYLRQVGRIGTILRQAFSMAPPPLSSPSLSDLLPWLAPLIKARRLGRNGFMELMRWMPMPARDFLGEWFEDEELKAALGAGGAAGGGLAPRAAGSALMLFYQAMNTSVQGQVVFCSSSFVRGGMGKLSEALANAARGWRAEVRTGAPVARILVEEGRTVGVLLDNGEQIRAPIVLSSVNPRHTFFDLVGAQHLEVRLVREVKNIRFVGGMARLNLALSALPTFRSVTHHPELDNPQALLSGHIWMCPSLDEIERASDSAKYGRIPARPILDAVIPTILEPSLAPEGQHLMSVDIYYAPYSLEEGTWDEKRQVLEERALQVLEEYAPGISGLIQQRQMITPLDMERDLGLIRGDVNHGQMSLDQLFFMRPVPYAARYATPLEGLFLCGAGSHPGGGVTGLPGRNAARTVLQKLR